MSILENILFSLLAAIAINIASSFIYAVIRREEGIKVNRALVWTLTLITGAALFTYLQAKPSPAQGSSNSSATASNSATAAPPSSLPIISPNDQSTSPSPAPGTWSRQWGPKDLLLTNAVYANLDSVPPNVNANNAGGTFLLYNNQLQGADIVPWTGNGSGTPTAAACANLVAPLGMETIKPVLHSTYCVKDSAGNMAILVVEEIDLDPDSYGNMTHVRVQATIWSSSN
jgi:hypothetical protein